MAQSSGFTRAPVSQQPAVPGYQPVDQASRQGIEVNPAVSTAGSVPQRPASLKKKSSTSRRSYNVNQRLNRSKTYDYDPDVAAWKSLCRTEYATAGMFGGVWLLNGAFTVAGVYAGAHFLAARIFLLLGVVPDAALATDKKVWALAVLFGALFHLGVSWTERRLWQRAGTVEGNIIQRFWYRLRYLWSLPLATLLLLGLVALTDIGSTYNGLHTVLAGKELFGFILPKTGWPFGVGVALAATWMAMASESGFSYHLNKAREIRAIGPDYIRRAYQTAHAAL